MSFAVWCGDVAPLFVSNYILQELYTGSAVYSFTALLIDTRVVSCVDQLRERLL